MKKSGRAELWKFEQQEENCLEIKLKNVIFRLLLYLKSMSVNEASKKAPTRI